MPKRKKKKAGLLFKVDDSFFCGLSHRLPPADAGARGDASLPDLHAHKGKQVMDGMEIVFIWSWSL